MFPASYELRVVDMNVSDLLDADLEWADLVFTSTMITQHVSLRAVVERCNRAGVPVVAGGPHPTTFHEEIGGVDHFVLDEVEETFAEFLRGSGKRDGQESVSGSAEAGCDPNAGSAVRSHRYRELRHG